MPRFVAIIPVLVLLTGWFGWQAISLGTTKPFSAQEVQASPALTAERYYDAVNETLSSGDPASLLSVLHPRFSDHLPNRAEPGTAQELVASLLELRSVFPDLRISASVSVLPGPVAVSLVVVSSGWEGNLEGLSTLIEAPALGYETLLINDRWVMERWSSAGLPVSPRLQVRAAIDQVGPAISRRTPRLERLSFDQFARISVAGHAGSIVIVESGSLHLRKASAAETVASSSSRTLASGQAVTLSASVPVELMNPGSERASILLLVIPPFDPPRETGYVVQPDALPTGITRDKLSEGPAMPADAGPFAITTCLIRITPGVSISTSGPALLYVNEGSAEIAEVTGRQGSDADGVVLSAGQHLSRDAGPALSIRANGPSEAAITLVSVVPANVSIPVCGVSGRR